jgi:hypothetical protein
MHRKAGSEARARELVALAVDAHPSHAALRAFEAALTADPLPEIEWERILLPPRPPKAEPPKDKEPKDA